MIVPQMLAQWLGAPNTHQAMGPFPKSVQSLVADSSDWITGPDQPLCPVSANHLSEEA